MSSYEIHIDMRWHKNGRRPIAEGLQEHLQTCLRSFYERFGRLPAEIVVSPAVADHAVDALMELEVPHMTVIVTGGCLLGEVWLATTEEDGNGNES